METELKLAPSPARSAVATLPTGIHIPERAVFRPATATTSLTVSLLAAEVVAGILLAASLVAQYVDLGRLLELGSSLPTTQDQGFSWQTAIPLVHTGFYGAGWVAYFFWVYRVQKNLRALGNHSLAFTPGWAVGWYFIPLFALYKPFKAIQEIWHGSDPNLLGTSPESWTHRSIPLLRWWWGFHLVAYFVQYLLNYVGSNIQTVGTMQQFVAASLLVLLFVRIPHAILKSVVVLRIHRRQLARYDELLSGDWPVASASA